MAEVISSIVVGVKLGIFIILLVYSVLIRTISKGKSVLWINLLALAFLVVALLEFFHITVDLDKFGALGEGAIHSDDVMHFLEDLFTIIAGLGLLGFLVNVNKNINDYK